MVAGGPPWWEVYIEQKYIYRSEGGRDGIIILGVNGQTCRSLPQEGILIFDGRVPRRQRRVCKSLHGSPASAPSFSFSHLIVHFIS